MKVIFLLNHFLPERQAGMEIYTFNLCRSLQRFGIEVAVLTPLFHGVNDRTYVYEGIRVIQFTENSKEDRSLTLGRVAPASIPRFVNVLKTESPDVVHFQEMSVGRGIGMFHLDAVVSLGIKTFMTFHLSSYSCQTGRLVYKDQKLCDGIIRQQRCTACSYNARGINEATSALLQVGAKFFHSIGVDPLKWNSKLGTTMGFPNLLVKKKLDLLRLMDMCESVIVLTKWYEEILIRNGAPRFKIVYCPQGLTGETVATTINVTKLPLRLVFFGRISQYKGIHLLIAACKRLPEQTYCLDIYGQITENEYAEECMLASGQMPSIRWMGSIPSVDVINTLTSYDVLCLPSTFSEMSPLVIQEAYAAGIPVLASNVYGNAEQIEPEVNGWLFEFKNVDSLVAKLNQLISTPRLIDTAKKKLPKTVPFDMVASKHVELYETVLVH